MREIIYAVVERLNDTLNFDGLTSAQENHAHTFSVVSDTEEYLIQFYGQCIWSTVNDPIPEDDEIENIFKLCLAEVVTLRQTILHLTSTIPNNSWVQ